METVCKKDLCTGCMACVDICPKNAISVEDEMMAYNAEIDISKCVNCDACKKVCQVNNEIKFNQPKYWKQGWALDEDIRKESSSGGFATAIELMFVKTMGSVCSCTFEKGNFVFKLVEREDKIHDFKGSKYVKSNPSGVYNLILHKIRAGEKVLFVGLPCQVAGVLKYVGNNDNLYTIDLICHGTPSPKILQSFLDIYNMKLQDINKISFRTKNTFQLEKDKLFNVPAVMDYYTHTFLNSVSYTENCYTCKYARTERISDITIGDSWGSELDTDEQNRGISLAICQTEKGKQLLMNSELCLFDVNIGRAIEYNHQLRHPSLKPDERKCFMNMIKDGDNFKKAIRKCYPKLFYKNIIKTILYKLKIYRGGIR